MSLNLNDQSDHPDDALLEDARMAASSDWEVNFVEDMLERRAAFGLRFKLSDRQREKLREIAEGREEDLFTRAPRWGRR